MLIAEVFICDAIRGYDKLYGYEVGEEIRDEVKVGKRILVPFGASNKRMEAFVVSVSEKQESREFKQIIQVINDKINLFDELIELLKWMKTRYISTMGEAVKCMIPPGVGIKEIKIIRLLKDNYEGTKREIELINRLKENDNQMEWDRLKEAMSYRNFNKLVSELEDKNVIDLFESHYQNVNEKTIRVAYISKDRQEILDEIEEGNLKRIQQIRVLEMLIDNEYISVSDLMRFAGVSISTISTLKKRGYIDFTEVEVIRDPFRGKFEKTFPLKPTDEQKKVIEYVEKAIDDKRYEEILIHGVTGSGKTEVYLQVIEKCIKAGRQAIVLVPEISLTPQMVKRFKGRLGERVAVIHSRLSLGERYDQWNMIREGKVNVVVGARSAIFSPFQNLGVIILDEEHEPSYKSEMKPRYHAAEIAKWRAKWNNAVVMYGSATPSIETYFNALNKKITLFEMVERTNKQKLPKVNIVDMRTELENGNRTIFSELLDFGITKNLKSGEQSILFINRRGYASFVLCRSCGYVSECRFCNISMTYHQHQDRLICHYCGFTEKNPTKCPKCESSYIRSFGIGTQKVEEEILKKYFNIKVIRMDLDTTSKKGGHEKILSEFEDGKADVLVGTQMIAKGHDFPNVTLVGVLAADSMLNTGDIRAPERTFQLVTQAAGRAGRGEKVGSVVLQAYNVDHYSLLTASRHDYTSFYESEIKLRKQMGYPPFVKLAVIVLSGTQDKLVSDMIKGVSQSISCIVKENVGYESIKIVGPARAPLSKIKGKYRWRIVLKCIDEDIMVELLTKVSDKFYKDKKDKMVDMYIDVNPYNMM